ELAYLRERRLDVVDVEVHVRMTGLAVRGERSTAVLRDLSHPVLALRHDAVAEGPTHHSRPEPLCAVDVLGRDLVVRHVSRHATYSTPMYRVIVLYDEAPDPDAYAEHVEL